eukprot:CAMPEP_0173379220 /NCGR_PEP_ID=MMETSP1356-20130122/2263_1 /TAXON_ID=77927 ORGANISM="Hemiselmis virescens, Strain PCC157" /NCGR_SAMPLE_ID=MMETSP1356 /ASSEMBLY_ACC=CAM_ASM_000847 /LENGTH=58 /DNA_ID=CAMNT_0014332525 /DNA_START=561 /DNA_END=733 /DNA_ORIENTATION=-
MRTSDYEGSETFSQFGALDIGCRNPPSGSLRTGPAGPPDACGVQFRSHLPGHSHGVFP